MYTILDLGKELKKLENFDKDEYIAKLEKEVARLIRNADLHVINHKKMYEELRAIKHARWVDKALRALTEAAFWARCGNDFDQSDIKHQYHILAEKWNWAARKCLAKSKEFE